MADNKGWDIPKRYLSLRLFQDGKEQKPLNRLDESAFVRFDTTAACSGALTEANITIGGLRTGTMFALATNSTLWIKDWLQHRIIIDSGYYNRHAVIFEGTVMDAVANLESADYTVTIKAITGFDKLPVAKSYCWPGAVPVATIAKTLARDAGWGFIDGLQDDSIVLYNHTTREQNIPNQLRMITQMLPVDLYLESGRLYLKRRGEPTKNQSPLTIYSNDIIGIPRPTQTGCKVKVRMNPWAHSGQPVKINSIRYPDLNSVDFFLDTISHAGNTYGGDWFTELTLTKKGLGYYNNG